MSVCKFRLGHKAGSLALEARQGGQLANTVLPGNECSFFFPGSKNLKSANKTRRRRGGGLAQSTGQYSTGFPELSEMVKGVS